MTPVSRNKTLRGRKCFTSVTDIQPWRKPVESERSRAKQKRPKIGLEIRRALNMVLPVCGFSHLEFHLNNRMLDR